jgi:outer membrane protein assembly factor BamB
MKYGWLVCLVLGTGVCVGSRTAGAEDLLWNQFRGPRGDGTSLAKNLPVTFAENSPEITWKTPVPGRGWASPVIWGNQVWLGNAPDLRPLKAGQEKLDEPLVMSAICINLTTGAIEKSIDLFDVYVPQITHETNSYASSTPLIEDGRFYAHFGAYGTACIDTNSFKVLWKRDDLPCDHFRGPGSSVAVYGDLLYLTMDGYDYQYLVALDKFTGKTVWRQERDIDPNTTNGDHKKAYSTPLLIDVAGRGLLVSPFATATTAYDPLNGDKLWTIRHGGMNAAARPLFGNGMVYVCTADGRNPLIAVNPQVSPPAEDRVIWRTTKQVPKRSSILLIGDALYMMNDSGVASCLDAMTGDVIWVKRLAGEYWSSPMWANGLVYCCSQHGEVQVFRASREFEHVAENRLDDGFNASPAVAGDALILRSKTHLYRIEKPR